MDKVLAFSILSASPADISAGAGFGGSWARLSWRRGADSEQPAASLREEKDKEKQGSRSRDGREHAKEGGRAAAAAAAPRFAPEFDGIDCFETIVSH